MIEKEEVSFCVVAIEKFLEISAYFLGVSDPEQIETEAEAT